MNQHFGHFPKTRLRRLRYKDNTRELAKETHLKVKDLILPLFVRHGRNIKKPIKSMPGHFQFSIDELDIELANIIQLGIEKIILFGVPEEKDPLGQDAYSEEGVIQSALSVIKKIAPSLLVITDVCLCEYTDHGHCGVTKSHDQVVDNDKTLELLVKQAISHAKAGADMIAPSGMIDGMVQALRHGLDIANYQEIPILSYAAKYASSLYGPFAEAAEGKPKAGDRRSLQMDFANSQEAIRECALDIDEGADMLMIKPAHTYLDIIANVKQTFPFIPLGGYHTSGEFAMIKAAAEKGWVNERSTVLEVLTAIRRAGADFIITYYAKEVCQWLTTKDNLI